MRRRTRIGLGFSAVVTSWLVTAPLGAAPGHFLEEELIKLPASGGAVVGETTRTWLLPGRMRKEEVGSGSVTILLADRGLLWVLDPKKKTYFELNRAEMDRLGELGMSVMAGVKGDGADWLKKSGRTKKVGSWEAYEVRIEDHPLPGVKISLWLSTDVPIDRALRDQINGQVFGASSPAARLLSGLRGLEGYPVEVVLTVRMGAQTLEMRQHLKKVEAVEVADDRFVVPPGYRQVESPFAALVGAAPAMASPTP